jgi:hypothetical protein
MSWRRIHVCTMSPVFLLFDSCVAMQTIGIPSSLDGPSYRIVPSAFCCCCREFGLFVFMVSDGSVRRPHVNTLVLFLCLASFP